VQERIGKVLLFPCTVKVILVLVVVVYYFILFLVLDKSDIMIIEQQFY